MNHPPTALVGFKDILLAPASVGYESSTNCVGGTSDKLQFVGLIQERDKLKSHRTGKSSVTKFAVGGKF
jgi:hypothetical protein